MEKGILSRLNGIFAVYKPPGITSAQCLNAIKTRLCKALKPSCNPKKLKLGHGGTLDPLATGVLVVGIGTGCSRLQSFLSGGKQYQFELLLGTHYDTFDITGKVFSEASFENVTEEMVLSVLPKFTGTIEQKPPAFSAVHVDGKRAYEIARKDGHVDIPARKIVIEALVLDRFDLPRLCCTADVGGGCYIRSLCVDMAEALNTKGAMSKLLRTRQGQFTIDHCLSIEDCSDPEKILKVLK